MPSSSPLAVAIAALLVLFGCGMLADDGPSNDAAPVDGPDHHELVFTADTGGADYEATVTVERDGEDVFTESIQSDGNGTYRNLTTLDDGPYAVVVNTTLPASGGGNASERFELPADPGNATAIRVTYQAIGTRTFELPRQPLEYELGAYSHYTDVDTNSIDLDVRVRHRGERVVDETASVDADQLQRVADLADTGAYHVAARTDGEWTNETVVVADPENHVYVEVNIRGEVERITVRPPREWQ